MAGEFLTVGSVTVPVEAKGGVSADAPLEVGDKGRAFDGTALSSIRARKAKWQIRTTPISRTDADSLTTALVASPPISCDGVLLGGATNCVATLLGEDAVKTGAGPLFQVRFELEEA